MVRHAGIGTYIRHLVPQIVAARPEWQFTLLVPADPPSDWVTERNTRIVPCGSAIYTIREQLEVPLRAPKGTDLFWSPHYNIPVLSRAPLVVTVHDVCHLALPELYGSGLRRLYAQRMFAAVRDRAREIVFDSEFSRAEFARLVGQPRKSTTIHLGVDRAWFAADGAGRPHARPYVLFVGSTKPHKNLGLLLRAFEQLRGDVDHDLVIIGGQKQRTIDTGALEAVRGFGSRVVAIDHVDNARLKAYVAHASVLVLPSLYEGFGLPPLEAMAAGVPALVSRAASLPEVCGDAALYCDPHDPADLASQLRRLIGDQTLRSRMIDAGRTHAARFDWRTCAERTLAVLERVLDGRD